MIKNVKVSVDIDLTLTEESSRLLVAEPREEIINRLSSNLTEMLEEEFMSTKECEKVNVVSKVNLIEEKENN